jgi:hypothetical protein
MNANKLLLDRFSNPDTAALYDARWPAEPHLAEQCRNGRQCGGCAFFAPLNKDWGLCCARSSRHFSETVFEHFTCPSQADEGWGPHSFTSDSEFMCRCQGEPVYAALSTLFAVLGDQSHLGPEHTSHLSILSEYVASQKRDKNRK